MQEIEYLTTNTSSCNWNIYNDYCRGEGFSPMTREQFERELGTALDMGCR